MARGSPSRSTRGGGGNVDIYVMQADGSSIVRASPTIRRRIRIPPGPPTGRACSSRASGTAAARSSACGWPTGASSASRRGCRAPSCRRPRATAATWPTRRSCSSGFQIQLLDLPPAQTRTVGTSGGACRPAFSPDTRRTGVRPPRFGAVAPRGRHRNQPPDAGRRPELWSYYPAYSPDGRYLAFSVSPEHHEGEDWDLAITDAARPGAITRLTSGPGQRPRPALAARDGAAQHETTRQRCGSACTSCRRGHDRPRGAARSVCGPGWPR